MKKIVLFLYLASALTTSLQAQDTVRYGDPWYQFNPLPSLIPGTMSADYGFFRNITCDNDDMKGYLGYETDNNTIYGIAVVMDSLPGPEWSFMALLLRGIEYHNHPILNTQIMVDSCYAQDTIKAWENPLIKRCQFEYYYTYDSTESSNKTASSNCFEFYFDTPITKQSSSGFADTFFVGVDVCSPVQDANACIPFCPKPCRSNTYSTPYLVLIRDRISGDPYDGFTMYVSPSHPSPFGNTNLYWGGIFPIIERRCTAPRGLALASDSLSAYWNSDSDAELFQLSVCSTTVEPDSGLLFITTAPMQTLPSFHPDSTYRLYLRKLCDFRQDSVWSDWSAPLIVTPHDPNDTVSVQQADPVYRYTAVAPNPATGKVKVTSSFGISSLEAYDAQGRKVHEFQIPNSEFSINLDVSSWPRGTYLLRIQTPAGPTTKKLLVQ